MNIDLRNTLFSHRWIYLNTIEDVKTKATSTVQQNVSDKGQGDGGL